MKVFASVSHCSGSLEPPNTSLIPQLTSTAITTFTYARVPGFEADRKAVLATTAKGMVLTSWNPSAYSNGDHGYQTWAGSDIALQDGWSTSCPAN